jgi:hypothetical protein
VDNDPFDAGVSRRSALKRLGAGAAIAWSAPAILSAHARAGAGSPQPGPGNCSFPVEAGQTITFSNLEIGACDAILLGALLGPNNYSLLFKPNGCGNPTGSNVVVVAPISGNVIPYMRDTAQGQCDCTYLSSNSTHAFCDGTTVYFQDSYFCNGFPGGDPGTGGCNQPHPDYPPRATSWNGRITVTIT